MGRYCPGQWLANWPLHNRAFSTAPLTIKQWLICFAMSSLVLWFSELRKFFLRAIDRRQKPSTHIHYHEHSASNAKD
ncbi:cation transporting ATPase C-terminal domain-containing protein [Pseudomonas sp. BBP2017]|uniref:cation transporting ATPase C-terminal domain-containing protein n=1 Tax=Pseudomonas sp. BBP2017 TaxID=2109731 RepID=UPI000D44773D|nr:cation transporting ATPase C-terminal domain-containing protein [Pseudomonas sp. BBP2017]PSS58768.1 hypothetical protein C6382_05430 [Pseudomonas sp. BBP2017]